MDHLCVRCTRQALRSSRLTQQRIGGTNSTRAFSQTTASSAGHFDLSQSLDATTNDSSKSSTDTATKPSSTPKVLPRTTRSTTPPGKVLARSPNAKTPGTLFGRTVGGASTASSQRSPPGVLLRRTSNPQGSDRSPPGVLVRRTGGPTGSSPGGATRGGNPSNRTPSRGSRIARITSPTDSRTGRSGGGFTRGGPSSSDPPLTDAELAQVSSIRAAAASTSSARDEEADEHIMELFEMREVELHNANLNNGLPIEPSPYIPEEQTSEELRKDWPDTAVSRTGLVEGVVQKLNFLARSLGHDYWTPRQIAERFLEGGLVKFHDDEHREKVMKYVAKIQREAASKMGIAGAMELAPEVKEGEQEFVSLTSQERVGAGGGKEGTNGATELVNKMVKGHYPELEKGQRVLYASVSRQLRNNESYGVGDVQKVMKRIEGLVASMGRQGGGGGVQQQSGKAA